MKESKVSLHTFQLEALFTSSKDTPIFKLLSASKSRPRPDVRLPITLPVLRLLADVWRRHRPCFHDHRTLFKAMFLTAFYSFKSRENYMQRHEFGKSIVTLPRPQFSPSQRGSCRGVHFIFTFFSNRAPSTVPFRLLKSTSNFSVTH